MFPKSIYTNQPTNNLGRISVLILLSFLLIPIKISKSLAESENADINTTVLFQPPPEESQPEETEGAASRQNRVCSQDIIAQQQKRSRLNLTAIVPHGNYGLTVVERPTFWVYIPQTSAQQIILTLKEKDSSPHWQQSIPLTTKAGIMGIKLSDNAPSLEIGKEYQWAVILVCGNKPHPNDPVVTAKIKRIDESQIRNGDSQTNSTIGLEQAATYAKQGIWYDTLDILVAEKSSLNNWNNIWVNYLQSGGLNEFVNESIIGK
ncbi:conserved hypothetical protein [Hyella patelloides LEGE 07179]|uniref:DUF928 domain-containing protein n=1 Tax=Hyella patelloides LEGE 07179 TaxID=945734 RepID=A0A563VWA5_9CYAN|nr:DUF928 domain-containing protein [Hyella patelloides]VEP15744.1 conserved hypothetical protein [Hyella patelloides LEGE 07179]